MNWLALVVLILVTYLLGAFPSGVVWGRLLKGVDVRQFGSGKTGATNSLRTLGWQVSLLVFVSDISKGALAVGLPMLLSALFFKQNGQDNTPWAVMACGLASIVGHNFSVFIGFKGGRGVSTGMGQLVTISPLAMLMVALVDVWVLLFSRYVSLASVVGCVLAELFIFCNIWLTNLDPRYLAWGLVVPGFILISHRDNIERLQKGTERKLGEKAKPVDNQPTPETANTSSKAALSRSSNSGNKAGNP